MLPVRDEKADSVAGISEFEELAPTSPQAADIARPTQAMWIMQPGLAPCRARIGKAYRAAIDVKDSPNISYGLELHGCPPPAEQDEDEAVVAGSPTSPGLCQIRPRSRSRRASAMSIRGTSGRATSRSRSRPASRRSAPQKTCTAPDCEMLWSFLQVDVAARPVAWSGAVNWMQTPAVPADVSAVCKYAIESFSGFFVPGPNNTATKVSDGQDHTLALTAVLADKTGAKVMLADGAGEYSTYDFQVDGSVKLARHVVWLLADAAAYGVDDRVGPVREPSAAGPPPTGPATPREPTLKPLSAPAHPE